jgi:hypothetical protein
VKKKLSIVLAVVLTLTLLLLGSSGYNPSVLGSTTYGSSELTMAHYHGCGSSGEHNCYCCGPSSGVSIGRYYRDVRGYGDLPDDDDMYDELCNCMLCCDKGSSCAVLPSYYGPKFKEMTNNSVYSVYHNFFYVEDGAAFAGEVDFEDYWNIVYAIDNGWPVALCANFWGVEEILGKGQGDPQGGNDWPANMSHYVVIRGYEWSTQPGNEYYYIECVDNYCRSDSLWLDWNDVYQIGGAVSTITITDNLIEDFEWGKSGDSFGTDGGDVNWTVTKGGSSKAVIWMSAKHSGTRGGLLYCDGTNTVTARYNQYPAPTDRGFYVNKYRLAFFGTTNGYNGYRTCVVMDKSQMLKYYDGSYHNVCQLDDNTWYLIELKNMNYVAGTFDIYVDGEPVKLGATMQVSGSYNNKVAYYSSSESGGHGSVYIDDIY